MATKKNTFINKCKSYFDSKHEIHILKEGFKKKLSIINAEIEKNNLNMLDNNYIHAKKYLEHKKAALICEFGVLQNIITSRIENDCENLNQLMSNQTPHINPTVPEIPINTVIKQNGGKINENMENSEYKIFKYLSKLSNNSDNEKTNTYVHLLNKHIQNGGEIIMDNTTLMNNILSGKYNLLTDVEKYKEGKEEIPNENIKCVKNNYNEEDFTVLNPKSKYFGTNYSCMESDTRYGLNYFESKYNYELRRTLKSNATDIFMNETLRYLNYQLLCNYTHFELSSFFYEFIYKYNLNIDENGKDNKKRLDDNEIILLYKGGNTTRMHIKLLIDNLKKIKQGSYKDLCDMYDELSLGDWDFNVNINFHKLIDHGYLKNDIIELINKCKQVSVMALHKVKLTFNNLLDGNISSNYARQMAWKFVLKSKKVVDEFENKINQLKKYKQHNIKINAKIIDAKVFNNEIDFSKIKYDEINEHTKEERKEEILCGEVKTNMNITKKLFKDSYIIVDKPIFANKKGHETGAKNRKNIDSVITFFSNKNLTEFIPNDMFKFNSLHIVYSDMLFFYRLKTMINFSLFRLKFNNTMRLEIGKSNNSGPMWENKNNGISCPGKDKNKKCDVVKIPIEIVDLSVLSIDDNRQDYDHLFFQKIGGITDKYSTINYSINDMLSSDTREDKSTPLTYTLNTYIPSANYMFYDIAEMLFVDNMFAWEDKKYDKRIRRLMYLSVICELLNSKSIDDLIADYQKLKAMFENIKSTFNHYQTKSHQKDCKTKPEETKPEETKPEETKPEETKGFYKKIEKKTKSEKTKSEETKKEETKSEDVSDKSFKQRLEFIKKMYKTTKGNKENSMIVINNEKVIPSEIHNIPETKLMVLENSKINFFIDKFISNYYESIILLQYFVNGDELTKIHREYCEYQTKLLHLIGGKTMVKHKMTDGNDYFPGIDYNSIDTYKTTTELSNLLNELCKYHNTIIKYANEIIGVLTNIKAEGISNIGNFDFSSEFLY